MKKMLMITVLVWATAFILPLFTTGISVYTPDVSGIDESVSSSTANTSQTDTNESSNTETAKTGEEKKDQDISLTVQVQGTVVQMTLDQYLLGVVAAEMPALYPIEALKAQAVAARTYCMYRLSGQKSKEYGGADLSDDSTKCMGYSSPAAMAAAWGDEAEGYEERIKQAVSETDGIIMTDAKGNALPAVFFAVSSGKTESAKDIWGTDIAFLVSRNSEWDAESPKFEANFEITADEFKKKFTAQYSNAQFENGKWFENYVRSDAGSVLTVTVGGVVVKGSDIRTLLGLQSANFTVSYKDGALTFKTKGYGHGVGMSQYGAKALASQGDDYTKILSAYYSSYNLSKIKK